MGFMLISTLLSLWVIKYVFMYSLCVFHLSDLIVFIYQVWVGNCMCVFPVVSPLFMKRNVLSLNTTAGIESDMVAVREWFEGKDKKEKRRGCFYPCEIYCGNLH